MSNDSILKYLEDRSVKKIKDICSEFYKETGEKLTFNECLNMSIEVLGEEVKNIGTGRLFLRRCLWNKNVVYLSGKDKVIGSQ